jgi:hypothetical protein
VSLGRLLVFIIPGALFLGVAGWTLHALIGAPEMGRRDPEWLMKVLTWDHWPDEIGTRLYDWGRKRYWVATNVAVRRQLAETAAREGPDAPATIKAMEELIEANFHVGDEWGLDTLSERITLQRSVLESRERTQGLAHPDTVEARRLLAWALPYSNSETETLRRRNVELCEREHGPDAEATLASLQELGRFLYRRNKSAAEREEGKALLLRHLETLERLHGPDDRRSIGSHRNLISCFDMGGDAATATELSRKQLASLQRTKGMTDNETRSAQFALSRLLEKQGDWDGANALWEADLEVLNHDAAKNAARIHANKRAQADLRRARDRATAASAAPRSSAAREE